MSIFKIYRESDEASAINGLEEIEVDETDFEILVDEYVKAKVKERETLWKRIHEDSMYEFLIRITKNEQYQLKFSNKARNQIEIHIKTIEDSIAMIETAEEINDITTRINEMLSKNTKIKEEGGTEVKIKLEELRKTAEESSAEIVRTIIEKEIKKQELMPRTEDEKVVRLNKNLKKFSGSEDVNDWIFDIEHDMKHNNMPLNQRFTAIYPFLEGTAKQQYKNFEKTSNSWEEFKNFLIKQYATKDRNTDLRRKLHNLKQES